MTNATAVVLIGAILFFVAPAADAGSKGGSLARKAHALAKKADKRARTAETRSKAALAAVQRSQVASIAVGGERGETGATGVKGERGSDGANGSVGARGANGAEGVAGRDGRDGLDGAAGADGVATLSVHPATNSGTVDVSGAGTTVVALTSPAAGRALVQVDAQLNGENTTAAGVGCEIRADGSTVAQRYVTVVGGAVVSLSASAVVESARSLAFVCQKSSSVAVVQVPAGRARLSVLGA